MKNLFSYFIASNNAYLYLPTSYYFIPFFDGSVLLVISKTSLFIGAFKILTFLWLETFVTTFNRMQLFYAIRQYTIKITV